MGDRPLFPLLFYVWVGCAIASVAIRLLIGVRIPFFLIFVVLICFGSLFAWMVQSFCDGVKAVVDPDRPKTAAEQQLFQPLIDLANSRNGTYEILGRAGKTVIENDLGTYTVTARVGTSKLQLVVSSPMPLDGFVLELSRDVIRRTDLTTFMCGDSNVDRELCVGSNDPELAKQVIDQSWQQLMVLGTDFSLTTVRGSLELRRQLPFLSDENTIETLNVHESLRYAIVGLSNARNAVG